jgi:hypothetical protein
MLEMALSDQNYWLMKAMGIEKGLGLGYTEVGDL